MNKSIAAPIVAFIILLVKTCFHIDIPDNLATDLTNWVVTGVSLIIVLWGIIKNHFKKEVE